MNLSELILMPQTLAFLAFLAFLGYITYSQRKEIKSYFTGNPNKAFITIGSIGFAILGILYLAFFVYHEFGKLPKVNSAGSFGDFLNPFIALVSAILVYSTIRVQIEANKVQRAALESETQHRDQKDLIDRIERNIHYAKSDIMNLSKQTGADYQGNLRTETGLGVVFGITRGIKNNTISNLYLPEHNIIVGCVFIMNNMLSQINKSIVNVAVQAQLRTTWTTTYNSYFIEYVTTIYGIKPETLADERNIWFREIYYKIKVLNEMIIENDRELMDLILSLGGEFL